MGMMHLADYIKDRRHALGFTQGQVAEYSGLKRSYISLLESMQIQVPSAEKMIKLAKGLRVEPEELYQAIGYRPQKRDDKPPLEVRICDEYGVDVDTARMACAVMEAFLIVRRKQSDNQSLVRQTTTPSGPYVNSRVFAFAR